MGATGEQKNKVFFKGKLTLKEIMCQKSID